MMPTPGHRAATWRAKSAPLIAPGMLTSVKSSLMSASVSKNRRASSALSASSTGYPASMNMSDAPIRSKTSSSTTRTAAGEGESVTDGNQHRPRWFHVCPDYKTGTRSYRTGHQRGAVSPDRFAALYTAFNGAPLHSKALRWPPARPTQVVNSIQSVSLGLVVLWHPPGHLTIQGPQDPALGWRFCRSTETRRSHAAKSVK